MRTLASVVQVDLHLCQTFLGVCCIFYISYYLSRVTQGWNVEWCNLLPVTAFQGLSAASSTNTSNAHSCTALLSYCDIPHCRLPLVMVIQIFPGLLVRFQSPAVIIPTYNSALHLWGQCTTFTSTLQLYRLLTLSCIYSDDAHLKQCPASIVMMPTYNSVLHL